jgi:hypothetical protein
MWSGREGTPKLVPLSTQFMPQSMGVSGFGASRPFWVARVMESEFEAFEMPHAHVKRDNHR